MSNPHRPAATGFRARSLVTQAHRPQNILQLLMGVPTHSQSYGYAILFGTIGFLAQWAGRRGSDTPWGDPKPLRDPTLRPTSTRVPVHADKGSCQAFGGQCVPWLA